MGDKHDIKSAVLYADNRAMLVTDITSEINAFSLPTIEKRKEECCFKLDSCSSGSLTFSVKNTPWYKRILWCIFPNTKPI